MGATKERAEVVLMPSQVLLQAALLAFNSCVGGNLRTCACGQDGREAHHP